METEKFEGSVPDKACKTGCCEIVLYDLISKPYKRASDLHKIKSYTIKNNNRNPLPIFNCYLCKFQFHQFLFHNIS